MTNKLKEAPPALLADRDERAMAKLARIARGDCWHGGARAMVLARRLRRSAIDADAIVTAAYSAHDGCARRYLAYHCPECGNACLGELAAYACCQPDDCEVSP